MPTKAQLLVFGTVLIGLLYLGGYQFYVTTPSKSTTGSLSGDLQRQLEAEQTRAAELKKENDHLKGLLQNERDQTKAAEARAAAEQAKESTETKTPVSSNGKPADSKTSNSKDKMCSKPSTRFCLKSRNRDPGCDVLILTIDSRPLGSFKHVPNSFPRGRDDKPNITTVMTYLESPAVANYHWARLHGYHFLRITVEDGKVFDGRHPSWVKIPVVSALLEHFDTVFHFDSDAFVRESLFRVEDEYEKCNLREGGNVIVASHDIGEDKTAGCVANAGVWVVRRGSDTKVMLSEWWNDMRQPQNEQYRFGWYLEQSILFKRGNAVHEKWKNKMCLKPVIYWGDAEWYGNWASIINHETSMFNREDTKMRGLIAASFHVLHLMECPQIPECCPPDYDIPTIAIEQLDFKGVMDDARSRML